MVTAHRSLEKSRWASRQTHRRLPCQRQSLEVYTLPPFFPHAGYCQLSSGHPLRTAGSSAISLLQPGGAPELSQCRPSMNPEPGSGDSKLHLQGVPGTGSGEQDPGSRQPCTERPWEHGPSTIPLLSTERRPAWRPPCLLCPAGRTRPVPHPCFTGAQPRNMNLPSLLALPFCPRTQLELASAHVYATS